MCLRALRIRWCDGGVNRLGIRLFVYTIAALFLGIAVFAVTQLGANSFIDAYLTGGNVREQRLESMAGSLQEYVSANGVSHNDKAALDDWVHQQQFVLLQVYSDGMVTYDSSMDVDLSALNIRGGDSMQWQKTYDIGFADGRGEAMFYEYFNVRDKYVGIALSALLGIAAFVIAFLLFVRRITRYITQLGEELRILEGGDLEHEIPVRGSDELGDLAQSIDDMRRGMLERQRDDDRVREQSYELVTAMSHDLRSPLTALIGYLDILSLDTAGLEIDRDRYLRDSRMKAYQIKDISDELFDYFLSFDKSTRTHEPETCRGDELFQQAVEPGLFELESAGFTVVESGGEVLASSLVRVDRMLAQRGFDNIFSNIVRHADASDPVRVSYAREGGDLLVRFENTMVPRPGDDGPDAAPEAGVGLRAARHAFEACGWRFSHRAAGNTFVVELRCVAGQGQDAPLHTGRT